jgi:hypothetical protein
VIKPEEDAPPWGVFAPASAAPPPPPPPPATPPLLPSTPPPPPPKAPDKPPVSKAPPASAPKAPGPAKAVRREEKPAPRKPPAPAREATPVAALPTTPSITAVTSARRWLWLLPMFALAVGFAGYVVHDLFGHRGELELGADQLPLPEGAKSPPTPPTPLPALPHGEASTSGLALPQLPATASTPPTPPSKARPPVRHGPVLVREWAKCRALFAKAQRKKACDAPAGAAVCARYQTLAGQMENGGEDEGLLVQVKELNRQLARYAP